MCDFSNQSPISELKPDCKTAWPHDCKTDLTDFTFLMPLRIDSEKRRENADTSISFILRHFDTTVIVVEGDRSKKYYPDLQTKNFLYDFIDDKNVLIPRFETEELISKTLLYIRKNFNNEGKKKN